MTRLSYSATQTYLGCSEQWRLHYLMKLRPIYKPSSLFYGGALDEAFGIMLLKKKEKLTEKEQIEIMLNPKIVFLKNMLRTNIANSDIYIKDSLFVKYFNGDYDKEFIEHYSYKVFKKADELDIELNTVDDIDDFIMQCRGIFKKKVQIDVESQQLYNYISWLAMVDKGFKLLDAYENEVLPMIETVISIQEKVNIVNDDGDNIIGYIDFIGTFKDEPGKVYIVDNKTSSKPYKADSVSISPQLATYCEYKNVTNAAYIVVEKKFRKRNPRIRINIIKDTVLDSTFEETFDQYEDVLLGIKNETFEKNLDNCFQYGQKCPYFKYCRDGCTSGLKDIREKDD